MTSPSQPCSGPGAQVSTVTHQTSSRPDGNSLRFISLSLSSPSPVGVGEWPHPGGFSSPFSLSTQVIVRRKGQGLSQNSVPSNSALYRLRLMLNIQTGKRFKRSFMSLLFY